MEVTIRVPDTLVQRLQAKWGTELPRHVVESWVLEDYRAGALTTEEVRQLLGYETQFEVHGFLKAHGVPFYTMEELGQDFATLDELRTR
jgi:Uncharacterised protein family (UPF0175)